MLKIYNTISQKIEQFEPIDKNNIKMYVCGSTVYSSPHIGNARPAVVFDVLYRILKKLFPNVVYVRNITDVDDKINKTALEQNITINELTKKTIAMYHADMAALYVLPVDYEPLATQHIDEMIALISKLIDNRKAYCVNNHVFFDITSFEHYGILSKKKCCEQEAGARVAIDVTKRNPMDFILWKPVCDEFRSGWESPWGYGRPGWHIECSAMSLKYLGEYFDIHGGGIDLIFPHHENENAQSCVLNKNKTMAKYWVYNGHLNISGKKMSKSLGNIETVQSLLQNFDGEVIRFMFLMTHYAAPLNFSENNLQNAKNILNKWYCAVRCCDIVLNKNEVSEEIFKLLCENMNTPAVISILHVMVDEINKENQILRKNKLASVFVNTCRNMLGILMKDAEDWFCNASCEEKKNINMLILERNNFKIQKNFAAADEIKLQLERLGINIEDTLNGTIWKKK